MKLAPILSAGLALLVAACGLDATGSTAKDDSYEATVRKADEARKSGDLDVAIPLYGRALQANPGGMEAKLGLGQSYLSLGAGDEAAAQFRDVLAKRSGDSTARRGLASALISMGQPELAQPQLDAALQADPRDYRALNAMGIALDMEGRHAEAQARYRQGMEIAPEFLALHNNLGLSLAITGQVQEAINQLAPIANGRESDGRVRQNLAFAYAMAGDLEHCLQISRRDLPEPLAQRQLSYFMQLKSLPVEARSAEIRRNPNFFPQGSRSI
ncbi:MAG TPA: tetratricopeptide repeat protein [Reyranella sp.]|jgi:Flp pilus assembly protein TadD|nr:tetratricopeptide repeat protein [Reyranella sp.]